MHFTNTLLILSLYLPGCYGGIFKLFSDREGKVLGDKKEVEKLVMWNINHKVLMINA